MTASRVCFGGVFLACFVQTQVRDDETSGRRVNRFVLDEILMAMLTMQIYQLLTYHNLQTKRT